MAGDGGQGKRGGITKPRLLGALSSDSTGELDVLGHDRHPLGVNRAQVGVLEKAHQIRLRRFLKEGWDGGVDLLVKMAGKVKITGKKSRWRGRSQDGGEKVKMAGIKFKMAGNK